jgi:ribosomal subunit interface protein
VDIVFKGRHTNVQDHFRQHATVKLTKLGKLDHKVIRVDVEVSKERNPRQYGRSERVELTIVSRGPAIRAEAAAGERYAALDLALAKLEARLRRACDRRKARHASHGPAKAADAPAGPARRAAPSGAAETAPAADDWPGQPLAGSAEQVANAAADGVVPIEMEGDGPLVVRQKFHAASPMTIDQALFEMELVGHDFYLFRDRQTGHSSVVYRRCGYRYGVIRLIEEQVPEQSGHLVAS